MSILNHKLAKNGITQAGENHLCINLSFPKPRQSKENKKPVSIIAVIDRSGSMDLPGYNGSGANLSSISNTIIVSSNSCSQLHPSSLNGGISLVPSNKITYNQASKLQYAKNALESLVDLMSPEDRLSIVSFDHIAEIVSEPLFLKESNKKILKSLINSIYSRGSTNIEDGLRKAESIISKDMLDDSIVKIIILSDGQANCGAQGPQALGKTAKEISSKGVIISSIGFGTHYEAEVMGAIAANGNGGLYHLDNPEKIYDIFQKEFNEAAKIIAKDVCVTIEIPDLVEIKENLNGYTQESSLNEIKINLGSIFTNKSIIIPIKNIMAEEINFKIKLSYSSKDKTSIFSDTVAIPVVEKNIFENLPEDKKLVKKIVDLIKEKAAMEVSGAYDSDNHNEVLRGIVNYQNNQNTIVSMYCSCATDSAFEQQLQDYKNKSVSADECKSTYSTSYNARRK